jgi:steroid delta-isomerase-like uncharacterized protein
VSDYPLDAVLFAPSRPLKGPAAIRPVFEALISEFAKPGSSLRIQLRCVEGDYAYLLRTVETADNSHQFAADSFVVRNGEIIAQCFAAKVKPKRCTARAANFASASPVDTRHAFMEPKQTIQAFVDAINSQDWNRLDSLVAPDFVRHSIAAGEPAVRSRADLVRFLRSEYETFPDAQETILDIFAEDEKVAVRHHFRGVQHGAIGSYLPSGKTMNAEYIAIYRVRNGQILEAWAEWDSHAGLRQLGHL